MLFLAASPSGSSRPAASCIADRFPFTIGRSRSADFQVEGPGVWDVHAAIFAEDGRFHVRPEGEALLLINDEPSAGALLRVGDRLSLGSVRLTVSLSPAQQTGLAARELALWVAVAAVSIAQAALLLAIG